MLVAFRQLVLVLATFAVFVMDGVAARPLVYPPPDRELMVPVEGGKVYVRVNGRIDGPRPPIILVHGGPGSTHKGLLDALELADDRAVILYDQLDSGRSDRPDNPANWTVRRFTDELEAIRKALGVKRWYVAGHSWGGTIALEYAAGRPQALVGTILASPLISTRSWIADADYLRSRLPQQIQQQLIGCDRPTPPPAEVCNAAVAKFYAEYNQREAASPAIKAYRHPLDRGFNARLYETMWGKSEFVSTGTLKTYDGEPLLAKLDGKRTLLIVGQHDEARPVTAAGFVERIPGSELAVVPGAAHGIFTDRPEETILLIRSWLARQEAA